MKRTTPIENTDKTKPAGRRAPQTRVPWLVLYSDLRRYFHRAFDQCARGRVILFYCRPTAGKRTLMMLVPQQSDRDFEYRRNMALHDFNNGRYKKVCLRNLPPLKRHKNQGPVIPTEEAWLCKNKKSLASVRKGIAQAGRCKTSKIDLSKLAPVE